MRRGAIYDDSRARAVVARRANSFDFDRFKSFATDRRIDTSDDAAEMNKWRSVSMLAVPACAGFGVYTLANVEHTHNEHPKYSYLRIRNREQFPWGGDLGLFEYPSKEH